MKKLIRWTKEDWEEFVLHEVKEIGEKENGFIEAQLDFSNKLLKFKRQERTDYIITYILILLAAIFCLKYL